MSIISSLTIPLPRCPSTIVEELPPRLALLYSNMLSSGLDLHRENISSYSEVLVASACEFSFCQRQIESIKFLFLVSFIQPWEDELLNCNKPNCRPISIANQILPDWHQSLLSTPAFFKVPVLPAKLPSDSSLDSYSRPLPVWHEGIRTC